MKFTPAMRRTLEAVDLGEVYDTGRIEGANPTSLRHAYKKGLVEWEWVHYGKYSLTEEGRKILEADNGKA